MNGYLLDTNILLISIRGGLSWEAKSKEFALDKSRNFVSVVTIGEIWSLALQNNWGESRVGKLVQLISEFIVVDINVETIIQRYAEIDAYSQGRLKDKPLKISARNMGKNDIWIAATASVLEIILLTNDNDFNHLDKVFLEVETI